MDSPWDRGIWHRLRHPRPWTLRLATTAVAVGWMAFIFYLSSRSPEDLPLEPLSWLGRFRDIVAHLVLFGVLGSLLLAALRSWARSPATVQLQWALLAISLAALYGALDEYHQSFVPGRSATVLDAVVDSVGAALSVVGGIAYRSLRWRRVNIPER